MNRKELFPSKLYWFNRVSLFIIFFWFGFLKVIGVSPAETLVTHLHSATIVSLISIQNFLVLLGIIECLIGVLWLFPRFTQAAFYIFIAQMFTTFLPLFYLPNDTWQNTMVLSLTGQYIVKNVALIALAINIWLVHREQNTVSTVSAQKLPKNVLAERL